MFRIFASLLAASSLVFGAAAKADTITIDIVETATGVSLSGSGSVDLTDMTLTIAGFDSSALRFINPLEGGFGLGAPGLADFYQTVTPILFGTELATLTGPGTGDIFGIAFSGGTAGFMVPAGYVSGDFLSFTLDFAGESFASLGITAMGTLTGATDANNTLILNFSSLADPVPLPAALPLFAAGIAGVGFMRRRKAAA